MDEVIEKMNNMVNLYHTMENLDGNRLNQLLQQMTSCLYYLETQRASLHNEWQREVKELVDSGDSVSRAENKAHVKFPNMYRLRRVMTSGYKVAEAIRTNISYLKSEMNQLN